jgi:hypothetical protein
MQPTTLLAATIALATTSVSALPSSSLAERQAFIGYLRFYGGTGCQEPWLEDTVFQQGDKCLSNTYTGPYGSFNIQTNGFTRTSKLACGRKGYNQRKEDGRTYCANYNSSPFRQPCLQRLRTGKLH